MFSKFTVNANLLDAAVAYKYKKIAEAEAWKIIDKICVFWDIYLLICLKKNRMLSKVYGNWVN